jgi:protein-disulfide isomerase
VAETADEYGKFWEMHDTLFENQGALADADLVAYAAALDIDPAWAASVLAEDAFVDRVRRDFMSGVRSGVNGTPTFFINGVRDDSGAWTDPESFVEILESAAAAGRA